MTDALPPLPDAIESALAELMEAQFRLGMATRHLGPSAIHRDAPQVLAASAAIVSVCNAVRRALAAPAVPPGWQWVPVEPTPAMLEAVKPFPHHLTAEHPDPADPWHRQIAVAVRVDQLCAASEYRQMLAAAPTPQQEPAPQPCACFPGTCRGGEVINGRLANGQVCAAAAAGGS